MISKSPQALNGILNHGFCVTGAMLFHLSYQSKLRSCVGWLAFCSVEVILGSSTVEPRFNGPLFNEVLDITNDILRPGQSYSKMYETEPRYNEPRYDEFFDITNIIRKPNRKIYLDITNYNVSTREKINAEQINSQQKLQSLW